ncbi:hypothetical protein WMV48_000331 [Campylobacter jejuni]
MKLSPTSCKDCRRTTKSDFKDVEVEFEIGGRGDFIVEVDGKVIFSKTQLINCESERFPYQNEINQLIKNRV